jgi:hypothetical protein
VVWKQAEREMESVLRENWSAVESVAERLLELETLSAEELKVILEAGSCERDQSAVARAFLDDEHERLVGRRFDCVDTEPKIGRRRRFRDRCVAAPKP